MYLKAGGQNIPLAGEWKYRIERSANNGALYSEPGEIVAHVAFVAAGGATGSAGASLPPVAAAPDVVIPLSVVPNEMKYTSAELTVQAGQLVELRFSNPDQMPHNFVLGVPGSLQAIGTAADQFSQRPGAAAQDYVPDVAQVLFRARLVDVGQSATIQFTTPATPGDYPYLCTYPNHWRIMNGVLCTSSRHQLAEVEAPGQAGRVERRDRTRSRWAAMKAAGKCGWGSSASDLRRR